MIENSKGKTVNPAVVEHMAMENEELRGLLRDVRVLLANSSYKISGTVAFLSSIDAALSQQAELTGPGLAFALTGGRHGEPDEPAPAQDERAAHVPDKVFQDEFQVWWEDHGQFCRAGGGDYERTFAFQAWRHLYPMLMQARATRPAQTEQQPAEGVHRNPYPAKCPVTGLPYFMHIEHPELGVIPTFGGPYDSYSIPHAGGSPDEQWHKRELISHRYCHDRGHWVDDEFIPLRIIHEDVLSELQDGAAPQPEQSDLRAIHAMILNALDRDAAEGKAVRGEMAAELRAALSAQGGE